MATAATGGEDDAVREEAGELEQKEGAREQTTTTTTTTSVQSAKDGDGARAVAAGDGDGGVKVKDEVETTTVNNATQNLDKNPFAPLGDEPAQGQPAHRQEVQASLVIHSSDARSDYVLDIVVIRTRKDGQTKSTNQGQQAEKLPAQETMADAGSEADVEAQPVQRRSGEGGRREGKAANLNDIEKAASERNWVTDPEMLPSIIPNARIIEFTFSDEIPTRADRSNAAALELSFSLGASRRACPNRPIIFIAYRSGTEVLNDMFSLPHALARKMFFHPRIPSEDQDYSVTPPDYIPPPPVFPPLPLLRPRRPSRPRLPPPPVLPPPPPPIRLAPRNVGVNRRKPRPNQDNSKMVDKKTSLSIVAGIFLLEVPFISSATLQTAIEQGILVRLYNKRDWKNRSYRNPDLVKVVSELGNGSMNKFSGTDDDNYVRLRRDIQQTFRYDCFLDAAFKNDYIALKGLLDGRLDPNRPKRFGLATLHIVASLGYVELVELLLTYGADVTAKASSDQGTALQLAAQNLHPEVVGLLLRKGAPIDVFDNNGFDFIKFTTEQRLRLSNPDITKEEENKIREVCQYLENPPLAEGPLMGDHSGEYFQDEPTLPPAKFGKEACLAYGITTCEFYHVATAPTDSYPKEASTTEFRTVKSHSVRDVLYTDILQKSSEQVKRHINGQELMFTWYHIPANNTAWVEGLFIKLKIQRWLQLDAYEHRGRTPHSRVMMPGLTEFGSRENSQCLSLFAPYLNTELQAFQKKMAKLIETEERNKYWNRMFGGQEKLKPGPSGEVIADKYLIKAYLNERRGLHIRRTLDQSHYSMLPDTKARDKDQVLLRHGIRRPMVVLVDQLWLWVIGNVVITSFPQRWDHSHRDDQDVLGMIMAYLRRRDREPIRSALNMASVIIEHCVGLLHLENSRLNQDYDIIDTYAAALGQCANEETVLLKKFHSNILKLSRLRSAITPKKKSHKPSIFDSSSSGSDVSTTASESDSSDISSSSSSSSDSSDSSSVATATSYELYLAKSDPKVTRKANKKIKKRQTVLRKSPKQLETRLLNSFNNITRETTQLIEIKDIKDELGMLIEVLESQQQGVESFLKVVPSNRAALNRTVAKGKEQISPLKHMSKKSEEIFEALNHLLDLKQKQANASEARTANVQAEQADKQGKTLMVFTTVTIIFLPLSFMAAFFAMPVKEFPKTPDGDTSMTLSFVSKWIFPISIAISIPFLFLAFSVNAISKTFSSFHRRVTAAAITRGSRHNSSVIVARGWKRRKLQFTWLFNMLWRITKRILRPVRKVSRLWRWLKSRRWTKKQRRWRRRMARKLRRKRRGAGGVSSDDSDTSSSGSSSLVSD